MSQTRLPRYQGMTRYRPLSRGEGGESLLLPPCPHYEPASTPSLLSSSMPCTTKCRSSPRLVRSSASALASSVEAVRVEAVRVAAVSPRIHSALDVAAATAVAGHSAGSVAQPPLASHVL